MGLFQSGKFKLHSGGKSSFKIECGYLSDEDWRTIASLIEGKLAFKDAVGIPSGGLKLAEALKFYRKADDSLPILIVDDVLTTGNSMERCREKTGGYCIGIVLFARGKCPRWVIPIFEINPNFREGKER